MVYTCALEPFGVLDRARSLSQKCAVLRAQSLRFCFSTCARLRSRTQHVERRDLGAAPPFNPTLLPRLPSFSFFWWSWWELNPLPTQFRMRFYCAVEPSQPHEKVLKLSPVQSAVEVSLMKLYKKVKAHYD